MSTSATYWISPRHGLSVTPDGIWLAGKHEKMVTDGHMLGLACRSLGGTRQSRNKCLLVLSAMFVEAHVNGWGDVCDPILGAAMEALDTSTRLGPSGFGPIGSLVQGDPQHINRAAIVIAGPQASRSDAYWQVEKCVDAQDDEPKPTQGSSIPVPSIESPTLTRPECVVGVSLSNAARMGALAAMRLAEAMVPAEQVNDVVIGATGCAPTAQDAYLYAKGWMFEIIDRQLRESLEGAAPGEPYWVGVCAQIDKVAKHSMASMR